MSVESALRDTVRTSETDQPLYTLATVMGLPLLGGFPALVLSGVLDSLLGSVQLGLLVFGGSATAVVVLREFDAGFQSHAPAILGLGGVLLGGAVVETALAPTIASVVDVALFEWFVAAVILSIAARTASNELGAVVPSPRYIVALGAIVSFRPWGAELQLLAQPALLWRAALAIAIATLFALAVLAVRSVILRHANIRRFRYGCAIALVALGGSVLGVTPAGASIGVFAVTLGLAYDPTAGDAPHSDIPPHPAD